MFLSKYGTFSDKNMSTDLIKNQRLRLPSGKKVESPNDILEYLEKVLFKQHPMSQKDISIAFGKSTKTAGRYITALIERKKIVKIEGTFKYKLIGDRATVQTVDSTRKISTKNDFYSSETANRFLENATMKNKKTFLAKIERICTGKRSKDFKIHPDNWLHPETTKEVIKLERQIQGRERLGASWRINLRSWIENGLGIPLEANAQQLRKMGLDGDKEEPKLSKQHMKKEQYDYVKKLLKPELQNFCKFGFRYWTFCRPSVLYMVKTSDLIFYERELKYVQINGDRITDPKEVKALVKNNFQVEQTLKHRACRLEDFKEFKTDQNFQKFIYDEEIVLALEKYQKERIKQGKKFLFWDNNATEFTFENYDRIVKTQISIDNENFKEVFLKAGFNRDDFGENFRANYALRHFGIQFWLQSTDYDYGLIASMGWKDINTLILWYGGYTAEHFQKKISGVFPN